MLARTCDTIWAALADRTRLALLQLLCERARSLGELVVITDILQPTVSKHLRVLLEAGCQPGAGPHSESAVPSKPVHQQYVKPGMPSGAEIPSPR